MAAAGAIPHLLSAMMAKDSGVRSVAISAISQFSKQRKIYFFIPYAHPNLDSTADLVVTIKGAIPHLLDLLKDEDLGVRSAAVSAIAEFLKQRKTSCLAHVRVFISNLQPTSTWPSMVPSPIFLVYWRKRIRAFARLLFQQSRNF